MGQPYPVERSWAVFFARAILGFIFFMAGHFTSSTSVGAGKGGVVTRITAWGAHETEVALSKHLDTIAAPSDVAVAGD